MINNSRRNFLIESLATLTASSVLLAENLSNKPIYSVSAIQTPNSPQKPVEWEDWTQMVYDSKKPRHASLTKIKGTNTIYEIIQDENGSIGAGLVIDSKYLNPQTSKK